jgi:RNA polymerase sigma factor (sigma-70 family)
LSETDCKTVVDAGESDEQLMAAFARGAGGESGDAFQTLFRRYGQAVFGFFRRRVWDAALAEELAQETFLAVLKARGRYEASALFRTYLYAIAFRVLKAHRRKTVFRAMFAGKTREHAEPVEEADGGPSVEAGLLAGLVMREAVGRLERMDREMVMLREFEELSYTEIAEVLGIPVNTVRSRLLRARMALRELLTEPAPWLEPGTDLAKDAKGIRGAEGRA